MNSTYQKSISNRTAIAQWHEWMMRTKSPSTAEGFFAVAMRFATDSKRLTAKPDSIEDIEIDDWVNQADGTKATTKLHLLAALRSYFTWAREKGYAIGNPANLVRVNMKKLAHIQKERVKKRPITHEEIALVLDRIGQRIIWLRAEIVRRVLAGHHEETVGHYRDELRQKIFWQFAVVFGRDAGLRLGDLAQMEWDSFATPGQCIVWTDKRDERVALPMTEAMTAVLALAPAKGPDERYLFPLERAEINSPRRALLSGRFWKILRTCGIKGVSFHSLRYHYASACAAAGIPTPHIKASLGHASEAQTRHYIRNE